LSVAGYGGDTLYFIIAERGSGTRELTAMHAGEEARLTGPLGNSWAGFAAPPATKPLALISGGVGIAPLAAFNTELSQRGFESVDFFAGFRRGTDGLKLLAMLEESLEKNQKRGQTLLVSEDGAVENAACGVRAVRGLVCDFLDAKKYAAVFACGPAPMMRAAAAICRKSATPCFVSLETRMACGVGACLGCSIPVRGGSFKRCCADGPIFDAREVFFDDGAD
jgi:NAD(P)H-flavin reductase